jgi:hypothetical protein
MPPRRMPAPCLAVTIPRPYFGLYSFVSRLMPAIEPLALHCSLRCCSYSTGNCAPWSWYRSPAGNRCRSERGFERCILACSCQACNSHGRSPSLGVPPPMLKLIKRNVVVPSDPAAASRSNCLRITPRKLRSSAPPESVSEAKQAPPCVAWAVAQSPRGVRSGAVGCTGCVLGPDVPAGHGAALTPAWCASHVSPVRCARTM